MPTAGTIDRLYVQAASAPGSSPKQFTFTVWKNGIAQALTCFMTGTGTANQTCSDLTHSVSVVATDTLL
jgi:hypothetical protein